MAKTNLEIAAMQLRQAARLLVKASQCCNSDKATARRAVNAAWADIEVVKCRWSPIMHEVGLTINGEELNDPKGIPRETENPH